MKTRLARLLVMVVLLLAAITILLPNLIPERNYKPTLPCAIQLNVLNHVIQDWAKQTGATNGTPVTLKTLGKFHRTLHAMVDGCPEGGVYTLVVGQPPKCSHGGPNHVCPEVSHKNVTSLGAAVIANDIAQTNYISKFDAEIIQVCRDFCVSKRLTTNGEFKIERRDINDWYVVDDVSRVFTLWFDVDPVTKRVISHGGE